MRALCRILRIGKSRRYLVHPIIRNRYWVRRFARRGCFDHDYDAVFVAPHALARELVDILPNDVPLFVQMDATIPQNERESGSWYRNSQALAWEREIFDRADHIFAMTDWAARSVHVAHGIAQSKISVIIPGSLIPEAFQSHLYPKEIPTIGFVGNPFHRKGGDDLLNLHQAQFASVAHLHIVSKDFRYKPSFVNVRHDPFISNESLIKEVMPTWDIFCFPTHFDMAPFVLAEAAACGLPTVATAVGGVPDICIDNVTGFVVEPGNNEQLASRLRQLIGDPSLRRSMGNRARQYAEDNFNADTAMTKLLDGVVDGIRRRQAILPSNLNPAGTSTAPPRERP